MRLFSAMRIYKKHQIWSIRLISISLLLFLSLFPNFAHSSCYKNEPKIHSVIIASDNANMPSGGTIVIQSLSDKKLDVNKLVDSKTGTKLVVPHTNFHILWIGDSARSIDYYSITSSNSNSKMDPRSWTLSGSNDNKTWTLLDEQRDQTFLRRKEIKEYSFYNNTDYKYYKLDINSNNGGTSTQIAEWTMRPFEGNVDYLISLSKGHSHSDLTPMGKFFENRHVTTEVDRLWLNNPSKDAALPEGDKRRLSRHSVRNLFPNTIPHFNDVIQHSLDNCGATAVLASMAYSYPEFVKSIIKDNRNGTYTVDMFDPQGNPIKVSVNTKFLVDSKDRLLGVFGRDNKPNWSTVLEKAMIKYNYIYKINRDYNLRGIEAEHVAPLFTGNGDSFAIADFTLHPEDLARLVNTCLKQGKFVLGGFKYSKLAVDKSSTIRAHVYTFMLSPYNNALFLMRNPWGNNPIIDDKKNGVLHIPNNFEVVPTIDVRIIEPGKAAKKEKR